MRNTRAFGYAVALGITLAALVATFSAAAAAQAVAAKPTCFGKAATIVGKAGADYLAGTKRADVIAGLGGNDRIEGLGAGDLICGGPGNDILLGGAGVDRVDGGAGFDTCRAGEKLAACEETRPALPRRGAIPTGEYVTDLFAPHLSLRLAAGWYSGCCNSPGEDATYVTLFHGKGTGDPALQFDSNSSKTPVAELVRMITAEPLLHATAPSPVTVAGVSGQRFELTIDANVGRLVPIPGLSRGSGLPPEYRCRVDVVSAGGSTITIMVITPPAIFAASLPLADEVLSTVKFR